MEVLVIIENTFCDGNSVKEIVGGIVESWNVVAVVHRRDSKEPERRVMHLDGGNIGLLVRLVGLLAVQ
jgi:hypothetical protein